MPAEEWGTRFDPVGLDGHAMPVEELPLAIALSQGRAAHTAFVIRSAAGEERTIEATAFPIVGHEGQSGAIAIFWSQPS
jgi:hypothetical protein